MSSEPTAPTPPASPARDPQSYFEKSFHANPALMAIARVADGILIEVNAAFERGSGYTRHELLGHTTADFGFWAQPGQRDEFLRRIATEGYVRDLEAKFRNRHGKILTLLLNADLFEFHAQPCMLTVCVDITERRRRDDVQAATYQISRVVLAGGDLPALFAEVHRILGTLMPAKNCYVALLSDDRRELSFPYFVDERVPSVAARPPANGFTEYLLDTGEPALVRAAELVTLLQARGRYQPIDHPAAQRIGAPLLLDGRAIGAIALQDYDNASAYDQRDLELLTFVAEQTAVAVGRRQAEIGLQRAEQNYRSIFVNALEGLYVSSPEGQFLRVNPALARMFGYASPEELLRDVNDIRRQIYVQPGRRDEFFTLIQGGDEVTDFESEVYRKDGTKIWISESVRVMRNADGSINHFEGVAIDITQRREAARTLQAAKEAADAASRAKSYFLASVSHELRTPLNGILGYTQILRRDALSDRQREGIRVIHESADHLLALINDVLDFSKIEAGRIELHPGDFDLLEFAASVERAFMARAREKTLLLETALGSELPRWVTGDEQRLRQIVFNLVGNAVKFTTRGGVVFSLQHGAAPQAIRFSVSDTGPGIADEDLAHLFEPFTHVSRHNIGTSGGTGLGLAISRSLVERMGGALHVESKPGWGSRFWFDVVLPTAASAPVSATAARRIVGYEGPRRKILVVDDNAANRAVMTEMLQPLGFALTSATDGREGVAAFDRVQPDLVLMDLRLPGAIDGLEATRQIRRRNLPTEARPKVIAVSASAYDIDRRECFEAGCDDFLAKPFREEELWSTIERALGLQWRFAGPEETRSPFPTVLHPPEPADAAAIHELALKGDVVGIREHAQAMLARDPNHAAFAQAVLELAARFKMKAIRQFVARYLPDPNTPTHA